MMTKDDFVRQCQEQGFTMESGGTCVRINSNKDYSAWASFAHNRQGAFHYATRNHGDSVFSLGWVCPLYREPNELAKVLAEKLETVVRSQDGNRFRYYNDRIVDERDHDLVISPRLADESPDEHLARVAAYAGTKYPPLAVTEAGWWDSEAHQLILSDRQKKQGIWSCQDQHVETQIVFAPHFSQGGDV